MDKTELEKVQKAEAGLNRPKALNVYTIDEFNELPINQTIGKKYSITGIDNFARRFSIVYFKEINDEGDVTWSYSLKPCGRKFTYKTAFKVVRLLQFHADPQNRTIFSPRFLRYGLGDAYVIERE